MSEALAEAFATTPPIEPPSSARVISSAPPTNDNPPPAAPDGPPPPSVRKLYAVVAKGCVYMIEGGLQRAVRYAGREPGEMDDDERDTINEGCEEILGRWFGKTEIGPWGKVLLCSAVAGTGMYRAGKPLPEKEKKPTAHLRSVPLEQADPLPPPDPKGSSGGR